MEHHKKQEIKGLLKEFEIQEDSILKIIQAQTESDEKEGVSVGSLANAIFGVELRCVQRMIVILKKLI